MSTKDETRSMASEIIAELSRKVEELSGEKKMSVNDMLKQIIDQNIEVEEKTYELSLLMEKIEHLAQRIYSTKGLDEDVKYSRDTADNFFLTRDEIRNDTIILLDYLGQADGIVHKLLSGEVA